MRVLIEITFRNHNIDDVVNYEVNFLNIGWVILLLLLHLRVISESSQHFEPFVKLFGMVDFMDPILY